MTTLRASALLCLVGCGRSGGLTESDLARLRPEWTMRDVTKAFGQGQGTEFPALVYPVWESDDEYAFIFDGQNSRLLEVLRVNPQTRASVRAWPPP